MLHRTWQLHAPTVPVIAVDRMLLIGSSIEQFPAAPRPGGGELTKSNVHL